MSETQNPFALAEPDRKPTLACVGYVEEISDAKATASERYMNSRVKIVSPNGGRDITTNFLFRPEWFERGFDPKSFDGLDVDDKTKRGLSMSYRRIFGTKGTVGLLTALVGGKVQEFAETLWAKGPVTEETVIDALREVSNAVQPDVGYILTQAREKTDSVNEEGKPVYVLSEFYEVQSVFIPTEDEQARIEKRAAKTKDGSFRVTWEH